MIKINLELLPILKQLNPWAMLRIADTLPPRYVADAQCKWVNIILQYTIDYGEFPVKYYE